MRDCRDIFNLTFLSNADPPQQEAKRIQWEISIAISRSRTNQCKASIDESITTFQFVTLWAKQRKKSIRWKLDLNWLLFYSMKNTMKTLKCQRNYEFSGIFSQSWATEEKVKCHVHRFTHFVQICILHGFQIIYSLACLALVTDTFSTHNGKHIIKKFNGIRSTARIHCTKYIHYMSNNV